MKKESPVKKFPGHVILPEYLNLPQVRDFEDAIGLENIDEADKKDDRIWLSVIAGKRLPVIFDCVLEWHIEGVPDEPTEDTFPMTPIADANELVGWLFGEIRQIWTGEVSDPKD